MDAAGHTLLVDVIVRPEYVVRYEQAQGNTYVHVEVVGKWTHRVARQFRNDVDAAHRLLGRPVFALFSPEANNAHFLKAHGFLQCGEVRDIKGRTVPIYGRSCPDGSDFRRRDD